jgi:hypothetical protein
MPNRTHRTPARPRAALALALALALVVGACSTTVPSPSPIPTVAPTARPATAPPPSPAGTPRPIAEVLAQIRTEVEGIRGLQPTAAVEPVVIDAAQLATNLEKEFDAEHDPKTLKDTEDVLTTLGLLPPGTSLRAITLAFQGGQVAGYYSPEQDELFVVSRGTAVGPADESTYAHEFTHQLQDQHIDLDKLGIDVNDQTDRSLARLALVEGDATSVQTTWMSKFLTSKEIGEVMAAGLDPAALEAFNNAPAYLRETALFPYQDGLAFVMRLVGQGGYAAVDGAFADPPDSTEQVLHPDKYVDREAPIPVKLPADLDGSLYPGWSIAGEDTLGELLLRIWLTNGGVASGTARVAAAGWGGDRLALIRGPSGEVAVKLRTVWDTAADADEFGAAALTAATKFGGSVDREPGSTTVDVYLGDFLASHPGETVPPAS